MPVNTMESIMVSEYRLLFSAVMIGLAMINHNLRRLAISVCISFIIILAMAENAGFVSSLDDLSIYDRIIDLLGKPAFIVVDLLMGEGLLLDRIWIYLGVAMIIYTIVTWMLLSLISWKLKNKSKT